MTLNGPFSQPEEGALFFVQFVILAKARIQSVALTPTLSLSIREGAFASAGVSVGGGLRVPRGAAYSTRGAAA